MKARRKEIGLSAEYVAEKLGVSPATVYRYENGDIEKFPGDRLEPIARILQTTPQTLMGWTNDAPMEQGGSPQKPTPVGERPISDEDIRAAFFGGADDLSEEEMSDMWNDAKDYIQYKLEQRRRKKNGGLD